MCPYIDLYQNQNHEKQQVENILSLLPHIG